MTTNPPPARVAARYSQPPYECIDFLNDSSAACSCKTIGCKDLKIFQSVRSYVTSRNTNVSREV